MQSVKGKCEKQIKTLLEIILLITQIQISELFQ